MDRNETEINRESRIQQDAAAIGETAVTGSANLTKQLFSAVGNAWVERAPLNDDGSRRFTRSDTASRKDHSRAQGNPSEPVAEAVDQGANIGLTEEQAAGYNRILEVGGAAGEAIVRALVEQAGGFDLLQEQVRAHDAAANRAV